MKIIRIFAAALTGIVLSVALTAPVAAAPSPPPADPGSSECVSGARCEVCNGIGLATTDASGGSCGDNGVQFGTILTALVNLLAIVVGLVAVIMIVVAGARFATSGGDTSKVTAAKSSLVYAIVGLVVAALAELIVHFVLAQVS